MAEAIERLSQHNYLFVSINADNVSYLPMLSVLRDATDIPIFIFTSTFTVDEQARALQYGADVFAPYQKTSKENVLSALAALHRFTDQRNYSREAHGLLQYKNLVILPDSYQAFIIDSEISVSKKEFDTLVFMISHRGMVLSYERIYCEVWGLGYDNAEHYLLWNHMLRLRKKIAQHNNGDCYIETVREVGYRLP